MVSLVMRILLTYLPLNLKVSLTPTLPSLIHQLFSHLSQAYVLVRCSLVLVALLAAALVIVALLAVALVIVALLAVALLAVAFSDDDVLQALFKLRQNKSDGSCVFTEHLKYASSVISEPLAAFFTSVVQHGYMPLCIRDSVLIPTPKGNKNTYCSQNYSAIALASILSKILQYLILTRYESFFNTSCLQFGLKPGLSTSMCTGALKSIVSRYINRGSTVFRCLLDASKAFDLVNCEVLFHKLVERGLPLPVVRFLSSWYCDQLRWGRSLSRSFPVSNVVRQGSVLSHVLFSVYLDSLLDRLADSSVGCYWGHQIAGALCYADDVVRSAPTASALWQMLSSYM